MVSRDPEIAILIPAYNEELVIEGTIKALLAADADRKDIYVVDDRSTDRTADLARKLGVHVFTVPENGGKARAQTAAIRHFQLIYKYDWIIFLDGDSKVDLYFVNAMFTAAKSDPSYALYVGQVKSVKNNHVYSASRANEYTYGHDMIKHGQSNFGVIFVSPGCASMYRCDVLRKLHIDHKTLAEDMDLTMQVHRAGHKVMYLSEAGVNTQDPNNFRDYHKQILRWYRGYWQVVLKHGVLNFTKPKQRVDVYMIAMMLDSLIFNRAFWLIGAFAVFPTHLATAFGVDFAFAAIIAAYVSWKTKRADVLYKLPQYYWLTHLSFYAYVRSFIEIVVLRKELLAWNKVKRYDFESQPVK
jgi:cellulose synthase/poly-beta-1,6-N-acetylglucosamine synthase-like glycosyltransferase